MTINGVVRIAVIISVSVHTRTEFIISIHIHTVRLCGSGRIAGGSIGSVDGGGGGSKIGVH